RVGEDPGARRVLAREDVLPIAARLMGFSIAATDFLVAHPEESTLLEDVGVRSADQLDAELAADVARLGLADGLRVFRRRAMVRVAARDLTGAPVEEVVEEITAVADACFAHACRGVGAGGFAVIGLGKLGGAELNYASDVDVLFVGGDDSAARRVVDVARRCFRVDADLRPEGRAGPLTRTLESYESYWDRWAAAWEFQAL